MEYIELRHTSGSVDCKVRLSSSKSESNRALIIDAVSGGECVLYNVSDARDTKTMKRLLENIDVFEELDVLDAGTTMRFLTAFSSVSGLSKVMTGTQRMKERLIGILVDALRSLGCQIEYLEKDGYPPLQLNGFSYAGNNKVSIQGNVSSQYISALLMIAPILPDGLELTLVGDIGSQPYIEMTLALMAEFGATHTWNSNVITVPNQKYTSNSYTIESDWSGASYWFSIAALAQSSDVFLFGLKEKSYQGDRAIVDMMESLGVAATFNEE